MNQQDFFTLKPILEELKIPLHINVTITTQEVQKVCVDAIKGLKSDARKAHRAYDNDQKARQVMLL